VESEDLTPILLADPNSSCPILLFVWLSFQFSGLRVSGFREIAVRRANAVR